MAAGDGGHRLGSAPCARPDGAAGPWRRAGRGRRLRDLPCLVAVRGGEPVGDAADRAERPRAGPVGLGCLVRAPASPARRWRRWPARVAPQRGVWWVTTHDDVAAALRFAPRLSPGVPASGRRRRLPHPKTCHPRALGGTDGHEVRLSSARFCGGPGARQAAGTNRVVTRDIRWAVRSGWHQPGRARNRDRRQWGRAGPG